MRTKKPGGKKWPTLPDRVLISHAYGDSMLKDEFLLHLLEHVDPFLFPRRDPDPHSAVSDGIVTRIRSCGRLIYLESGPSEEPTSKDTMHFVPV
jgi:hypothetical protein